jgi:hypothetical protein
MSSRRNQKQKPTGAARSRGQIKDPEEWVTGDEPLTGAQESYLETLGREAGEDVDTDLSKAEASERIEELQRKTGRRP